MEIVLNSMGSQTKLREIETRLLKLIESGPTTAGRDFAFDQLAFIATDASVPLLRSLLERAETAEQARFLLERIPGPAASEALRKRLENATGNTKIGIINSLGRRRDIASVPQLAGLISASDKGITEAALAALQSIGDPAAIKALAMERSKLNGILREEASEAYAECADQLAKRGDTATAVRMYRELIAPQESSVVRIRAMAGLVTLEGKNAIPVLTAAIHSKNRSEQAAAMTFLNRIPGADSTKVMIAEFPKLTAPGQVRVLAALADRGDVSAKTLALIALKNNSGDVRAAGLAALGKLGDESSVMVLAEAAAERPGPEQEAARQSLGELRGAKVDSTIVEGIRSKSGKVRTELIVASGERGMVSAADALATALDDADPEVQRAALRSFRNVGGSAQVPALLEKLANASRASDRREITHTLSAVLRRSEPSRINSVLSAYRANPPLESRLGLLEVLGQSGNEAALPVLRSGLKDPNPEISRGAILALSSWRSPVPLDDLYAIAKEGKDPTLKILALRGYVKLIGLPSQRPASESARLLSEAMQLAKEPAEKRSVLSLLSSYPSKESLQLAEGLLRDDTVANEAKAAAARLRIAMRQQ
jgi:HEAT repeat protein